jgi:hypothetical protein
MIATVIFDTTEKDIAFMKARRASYVREREKVLNEQKSCGDREKARDLSVRAKELLRKERAVNLVLAVIDGSAGRLPSVPAEIEQEFLSERHALEIMDTHHDDLPGQ